ncbi:MAG: superoxide dismutase [Planctomycetes bacterium]|nr:superoxide dismutase [Planctomycetota bacterium]
MPFEQPPLPYAKDALVPHLSAEHFDFHYGKHHKAYLDKLNELTAGKPEASKSLEELIKTTEGVLFNQAAQVWNHTFYWSCLKKGGGGAPTGKLADAIKRDFGSFDDFKKKFSEAGMTQFGSGWAWLVYKGGKLEVAKTPNAECPIKGGATPIITCDVWEHAYYIDYRNARAKFLDVFLANLANWDFANANYEKAGGK